VKNTYQDCIKRTAKLFHRNDRGATFVNGLFAREQSVFPMPTELSWWEDVTFIRNKYRVSILWTHPRCLYDDAISAKSLENLSHLSLAENDPFESSTPQYVKVGKSCKKIGSYLANNSPNQDYYKKLQDEQQRLRQDNDIQIRPHVISYWTKHCRIVDICAPLDVRNHQDVATLVTLVKRLLNRETSLSQEFPNYCYTQHDSVLENQNIDQNNHS
jgi:hypothetical protein